MNNLDFSRMNIAECDADTIGELMAPLLNPDWYSDAPSRDGECTIDYYRPNVAAADLITLVEVGKGMLYDAIGVAADQDDTEFFEQAFSLYGHLIDAAIEEMDPPRRCTLCGVLQSHEDCKHRRGRS
jgi:hypothetical protein